MARKPLYTTAEFNAAVDQFQSVYDTATPADAVEGMRWYADAHAEIRKAALVTRLPENVLASCLAVLSIQTAWDDNLSGFWSHVDAYANNAPAPRTRTTIARSDRVAGEILRTGDAALLGDGPKTNQFALDVVETFSPEGATIDSIMTQAGLLEVPSAGLSVGKYALLQAAVCHLAHVHGILPYQLQAIVWVAWRRHHSAAFKAARRAQRRAAKQAEALACAA